VTGDLEAARRVKIQLLERLSADSRLRGIGLAPQPDAPGSYAVVVRVTEVSYAQELDLPTAVDGVVVQVTTVGDIVAWEADTATGEAVVVDRAAGPDDSSTPPVPPVPPPSAG